MDARISVHSIDIPGPYSKVEKLILHSARGNTIDSVLANALNDAIARRVNVRILAGSNLMAPKRIVAYRRELPPIEYAVADGSMVYVEEPGLVSSPGAFYVASYWAGRQLTAWFDKLWTS